MRFMVMVKATKESEAGVMPGEQLLREMATYPYVSSVRGDCLERLGRLEEARGEFERAAGLTKNSREKALLLARAHACEVTTGKEAR